jgi:hypothetical protein
VKDFLYHVFEKGAQGKGVIKVEIKKRIREWSESVESDNKKREHILAFWDFCFDLLEEEYGKITPEEKIDPRFVKGLLISL